MRMFHPFKRRMRRGLLCLVAVALLCLCLASCSNQVLNPDGTIGNIGDPETLYIDTSGAGGNHLGNTVTESETVGGISLPSSGDFSDAAHVLRVDFLNVGDADSILLRMDGTVILIDTGESNDDTTIRSTLTEYGINVIDYLIITHYDNDHIGSARSLLSDYTVKNVYMPDYVRNSGLYRNMMGVLNVLEATGTTVVHRVTEDVHLDIGYGQVWINPTKLYQPGLTLGSDDSHSLQENNYSLITSVTFGEIALLFTGDAEGERIAEFSALLGDSIPAYHLLKIPHHGGFDKELGDFLRVVKGNLRYCVVSVASEDSAEASLKTAMKASGAGQYYTGNGRVQFATDGSTMTMVQGS